MRNFRETLHDPSFPRILVLSDGKPGHYNQSLGIMDRMNHAFMRIIEIKFRRKWRDDLLRVLTRLLYGIKLPREIIKAMLKWAMEKSSAETLLEARNFDLILSTGSSVAVPNLLLGKLTGAKTVVCTKPSPLGIRHFDLAILPEHTRLRHPGKNVVMTFGVPNRISPEYVRKAGINLASRLHIDGQRVIGLLLGGEDPYYSIPPNMVTSLCDALIGVCREIDAYLVLTTSRRTDPRAEDIIRAKVLNNPLCRFSVLASQPQQGNPVPGILGVSDVTIVTEDSFSMVCEAASSGKKIMILNVERKKKNGNPKRERVYRLMVERGYIRRTDISNLKDAIQDLIHDATEPKVLDDAQIAADALCRLINARR